MPRSRASSTLRTAPPPDPTLSDLENTLHLTPLPSISPTLFTNTRPQWLPPSARGIYGGAVIAQSLLAATATVPPALFPHSMHCYFVLAGNPSLPILYDVLTVREGRSFHTRTVNAKQQGRTIFTCTISFTKHVVEERNDDGEVVGKRVVAHQPALRANLPPPDECETEGAVIERLLREGRIDEERAQEARKNWEKDPWDWRRIPSVYPREVPPSERVVHSWVRMKQPVVQQGMQLACLAYLTDSWLLGTVGRVNRKARSSEVGMMVSLDHTIHFHTPEVKMGDWMVVETAAPWAGGERGLAWERIYTADGVLLASCQQEGMVRLKDGRQGDAAESKL